MTTQRTPSSGFVHLGVRSAHSHLYGASRLDELIQAARALGYHDLALTDRNGLYGSIAFYRKAREAGLRPILGVELTGDHAPPAATHLAGGLARRAMPGRAVCLARNLEGYRTLCRLTTARHLAPSFDLAEVLASDHGEIYVLAPDASLLARLAGRLPPGRLFALIEEFGDRSMRLRNDGLARAASRRGIPLVGGGAVAFHVPSRFEAHRTLRAIATLTTVADVPRRELAHPRAYLKGPDEMAALLARYPEAAVNTVRIAADCRLDLPLGRPVFPRAAVPEGETAYSHLAQLAFAGLRERYRPLRPEAVHRLETELATIDRLGFSDYFLILHGIADWTRRQGIPCVARGSAAGSLAAYCLRLSGVDPLKYGLLFERFLNLERADCPDIDLDVCWRRRDDVLRHVYETYGAARTAMISTHQTFQARSAFREVAKAHGLPPEEVDRLSRRLPSCGADAIRDAALVFPECRDFPLDRPDIAHIVDLAAAIDGLPRHLSVHVGGVVIADRPLTDYLPLQPAAKGIVIAQYEAGAVEALGLVKMDILAQRSLSILATAAAEVKKNHGIEIDLSAVEDGDAAAAGLLARGDTFGCFQIESPGMRNLLKMMNARSRMDVILGLSLIRPGPASSGMKDRFVRRRRGLEPPEVLHPALRDVLGDTHGVMLYQEDVIRVAHAAAGLTLAEGDRLRKDLGKGPAAPEVEAWRARFLRGAVARGAGRQQAETLWERLAQFAAYSYCKAHACTYGEIAYRAVYLRARWPAEFAAAVLANQAGYYERRTYLEDARRHGCAVLGPDVNASGIEPTTEWVATTHLAGGLARRVAVRLGLMDVRGLSERSMRRVVGARAEGGSYRSVADLLARVPLAREEAENLALAGAMDALAGNRPQALWLVHAALAAPRETLPLLDGGLSRPAGAVANGHETAGGLLDGEISPARVRTDRLAAASRGPLKMTVPDASGREAAPDLPDFSPLEKLQLEEHLLGMTPSANPMAVYRDLMRSGISDLRSEISDLSPPRERRGTRLHNSPPILLIADLAGHTGQEVAGRARQDLAGHAGQDLAGRAGQKVAGRAGQQVAVAGVLFAERRARTRTGEFMKFLSLEDESGIIEAVLLPDAYQRLGGRITTRGPYRVTGTVEDHLGAISLMVTDLRRVQAAPGLSVQTAQEIAD